MPTRATENKHVLLVAWVVLHTVGIGVLFVLDTELARSYKNHGPTGLAYLIIIMTSDTFWYASLWNSNPGFVTTARDGDHGQPQEPFCNTASRAGKFRALHTRKSSNSADVHTAQADCAIVTPCDTKKVCQVCGPYVGLRTHHCRACTRCVQGFDHHCFWLGTCVGQNNHSRFLAYMVSETILVAYGVHNGLTALRLSAHKPWTWVETMAALYTMDVLVLFIVIGGLCCFHSFLVLSNQTTHEIVRGQALEYLKPLPVGVSPFSRGPIQNVFNFITNRRMYDMPVEGHDMQMQATIFDNAYYSCC